MNSLQLLLPRKVTDPSSTICHLSRPSFELLTFGRACKFLHVDHHFADWDTPGKRSVVKNYLSRTHAKSERLRGGTSRPGVRLSVCPNGLQVASWSEKAGIGLSRNLKNIYRCDFDINSCTPPNSKIEKNIFGRTRSRKVLYIAF